MFFKLNKLVQDWLSCLAHPRYTQRATGVLYKLPLTSEKSYVGQMGGRVSDCMKEQFKEKVSLHTLLKRMAKPTLESRYSMMQGLVAKVKGHVNFWRHST